MKRNEAVTCLKEISASCNGMALDWVALVESKSSDPQSIGYQVHIHTFIDIETRRRLQSIAGKRSLVLREEKDKGVIYQPKTRSN